MLVKKTMILHCNHGRSIPSGVLVGKKGVEPLSTKVDDILSATCIPFQHLPVAILNKFTVTHTYLLLL